MVQCVLATPLLTTDYWVLTSYLPSTWGCSHVLSAKNWWSRAVMSTTGFRLSKLRLRHSKFQSWYWDWYCDFLCWYCWYSTLVSRHLEIQSNFVCQIQEEPTYMMVFNLCHISSCCWHITFCCWQIGSCPVSAWCMVSAWWVLVTIPVDGNLAETQMKKWWKFKLCLTSRTKLKATLKTLNGYFRYKMMKEWGGMHMCLTYCHK